MFHAPRETDCFTVQGIMEQDKACPLKRSVAHRVNSRRWNRR